MKTKKSERDDHGNALTVKYIQYAMDDTQATWECYEKLANQCSQLGLNQSISRIYSEASIGKANFQEMNIRSWQKCSRFSSRDY